MSVKGGGGISKSANVDAGGPKISQLIKFYSIKHKIERSKDDQKVGFPKLKYLAYYDLGDTLRERYKNIWGRFGRLSLLKRRVVNLLSKSKILGPAINGCLLTVRGEGVWTLAENVC